MAVPRRPGEWSTARCGCAFVLMDEADHPGESSHSEFDAVALSESKRALDTIPTSISGWRQSFEYGLSTNARIRSLSAAQDEGFSRFSAGQRNGEQSPLDSVAHVLPRTAHLQMLNMRKVVVAQSMGSAEGQLFGTNIDQRIPADIGAEPVYL